MTSTVQTPASDLRATTISLGPARSTTSALLAACRPRHWSKNLLVLAAPAAAGVLTDAGATSRALVAGLVFCLAASGTYLLNDVFDVEADRRHPVKRLRPIATGEISPQLARATAIAAFIAAALIAGAVSTGLLAVVMAYVTLTFSYSAHLKHIAVVDVVAVAAGFVLRAVAGGVAAGIALSPWFLVVASAGSLFLVSGKRHGELVALGDAAAHHRATLGEYSKSYTQLLMISTASVTLLAYCLWAFEDQGRSGGLLTGLSVAPFTIAILRYALLVDQGQGGDPVETLVGDRHIRVAILSCVALILAGVHVI